MHRGSASKQAPSRAPHSSWAWGACALSVVHCGAPALLPMAVLVPYSLLFWAQPLPYTCACSITNPILQARVHAYAPMTWPAWQSSACTAMENVSMHLRTRHLPSSCRVACTQWLPYQPEHPIKQTHTANTPAGHACALSPPPAYIQLVLDGNSIFCWSRAMCPTGGVAGVPTHGIPMHTQRRAMSTGLI